MSGLVKTVGKVLISPIGAALGLFDRKPAAPIQQPSRPTVNEAAMRAAENDRLARRRGTGANRRTGRGGAEAQTGPKKSLLGRG